MKKGAKRSGGKALARESGKTQKREGEANERGLTKKKTKSTTEQT